jgi:lipid A 3-O-deacylase
MRNACVGLSAVIAVGLFSSSAAVAGDNFISELRVGALAHDQGFTTHKEDGVDVAAEVVFSDTGWLGDGWTLRPNLGTDINTDGKTSQVYLGMLAGHRLFGPVFFDVGAGGAWHDGKLDTNDPDRHSLGCRVIFHLEGDLGVDLGENWALMAHIDHISNANLCDRNEGLTNLGALISYRFD